MDYPKSVPGVGLVDGKFVDEDKAVPRAGSLIPAAWGNAVTDSIKAVQDAGGLAADETDPGQLLAAILSLIAGGGLGQVGASVDAQVNVKVVGNTATFTARDVVTIDPRNGRRYRIANVNRVLDLTADMDVGTAPKGGAVGVYFFVKPDDGQVAVRLVDASVAMIGDVYAGANAPAGFYASARVAVLVVNGSGQFPIQFMDGRTVRFPSAGVLLESVSRPTYAALSVAASVLPPCARSAFVTVDATSNLNGTYLEHWIAADANGLAETVYAANQPTAQQGSRRGPFEIPVLTPSTLYRKSSTSGGTPSYSVSLTGFRF